VAAGAGGVAREDGDAVAAREERGSERAADEPGPSSDQHSVHRADLVFQAGGSKG
jgi:hypothetical protein